jgi:photosystem II stability/assembly factor-like uncharacterized protein
VSLDSGRTWSSWYNQPTGQFYHVITDDQFPYRVYGAQQDAGTAATLSRSDYGEITFRDWQPVGAGESGYIAPDPLHPEIVYGGDTYGGVFRFDRVTGQSQDIAPWPLSFFGVPVPERKYRFTWTSPLVFDRRDPHLLYLGAQVVFGTRDGGLHWTTLSPDLTGAVPAARPARGPVTLADAVTRGYGVIYTIAPSPLRSGLIWVGTDDGLIQLTVDGGQHWRNVTPPGLEPWSKISLIDAAPFDTGAAYAAVDRHRLDDLAPYAYRTRDYGKHWTRIDAGIAPHAYVHVVRADPVRRGLLYAGTELGVYVSFDDGDHWQPLQLNLPVVSVRDLVVHGGDLIAATHGRSFWILDDVTPLEQLTDDVLQAPAFLVRPARARRLRRSENHDTPLPPEEPHGTNPPAGAIIDYTLKTASLGPVTLEILDARGNVVRRFSTEATAGGAPEPPQFASEWLPRPESLTRHPGHNRFVWDLRYPPPPVARHEYSIAAIPGEGTVEEPEGPLVLPGDYAVKLTVAGRSYVQPLQVELDPRVHVAPAALAAQLRLALEIWNQAATQHALHGAAHRLRDALTGLGNRQLDADTRAAVSTVEQRVDSLFHASASGDLGSLETVVESADREPTAQARSAFAELRARVAAHERRWQALTTEDLPALNTRLARAGLAPLAPTREHTDTLPLPAGANR